MTLQRTVQRTSVALDFGWAPGGLRVASVASQLANHPDAGSAELDDGEGSRRIQGPQVVFGHLGKNPLQWEGGRYVSDVLAALIDTQRRGRRFNGDAFMERIAASGLPPLLPKKPDGPPESELIGLWLRAATISSVALHLGRLDPAPQTEEDLLEELTGGPFMRRGSTVKQPWADHAAWYHRWALAEYKDVPVGGSPAAFRASLAAMLRRRFVRDHGVRMRLDLGDPVIMCGTLAWARLELADRLVNAPAHATKCPECHARFQPARAGQEFCGPTCRRTFRRRGGPRPVSSV